MTEGPGFYIQVIICLNIISKMGERSVVVSSPETALGPTQRIISNFYILIRSTNTIRRGNLSVPVIRRRNIIVYYDIAPCKHVINM